MSTFEDARTESIKERNMSREEEEATVLQRHTFMGSPKGWIPPSRTEN